MRKFSKTSPGWWDYTTLDERILENAEKLSEKDILKLSRPGFKINYLVILVDGFRKWKWLVKAAYKRLLEELEKLDIKVNIQKTQIVDLTLGETFGFLGFDFRRVKTC